MKASDATRSAVRPAAGSSVGSPVGPSVDSAGGPGSAPGGPAPAPGGDTSDRAAGQAFRLLYGAALPFSVSFWTLLILVPLLAVREGYNLGGVGLLAALPGLLQIGTRLVTGAAADQWGEVPLLRLCFAFMVAAALAVARPHPALGALIATQVLGGVGRGIFWPAAQSYASRLPGDPARHLSRVTGSNYVGSIAALLFAGAASQAFGFTPVFLAAAVLSAVALGLSWLLPQTTRASRRRVGDTLAHFPSLLGRPAIWLAALCAFLAAVPNALTLSFFPLYALHLGLSRGAATAITDMRNLGGLAATAGFVLFRRHVGDRHGLPLSLLLVAVGLALVLLPGPAPYAFAIALAGAAGGLANLYYLLVATRHSAPAERGAAIALTGACWALSLVITPAFFGLLAQSAGYSAAFLTFATASGAGAAVAAWGYARAAGTGSDRSD